MDSVDSNKKGEAAFDYTAANNRPAADEYEQDINSEPLQSVGKERPQSSDPTKEHYLDPGVALLDEPTEQDKRLWTANSHVDPSMIPRAVSGGMSRQSHIGFSNGNPTTNFEYFLANASLPLFDTSTGIEGGRTSARAEGVDRGDDDGESGGGRNDATWDRYDEYGDYFKGHDKDWEDGLGPNGGHSSGTGGGYRKPEGGYYSLSSVLGLEDKISKLLL
jgi:hypothetical protein